MFAIHFICVGALVLAMAAFNGLAGENDLGQGQGNDGVEVPQVGGNGAPPRLQWTTTMSGFILRRFTELVAEGVRTDKGFKDVHVN